MNEGGKSRLEVIVTSYGRNKNLDEIKTLPEEMKKQPEVEKSPSSLY